MIQLNLLPDVKLLYIKAQRQRRLVMGSSVLVGGGAIVLLLLLLSVNGLQKKHINDLTSDINSENSQLEREPDVDKILTVQNQLDSLTPLQDQKPAASRLFGFLNESTPASVSITTFTIDFTAGTVTVSGTSDSLSNVNKYVDTLKFTTFTTADNDTPSPAFSDVVLSSFGLSTATKDASQAASFTINLTYDKTIFDITKKVNLTVPSTTTTRAKVSQPSDLFKSKPAAPATTPSGGTN
jgi:Tfp pilus assembly protein PilN